MSIFDPITRPQISRRSLFKGAGALAAGLTLAQAAFLKTAAAQSESIQDVLNITATVEAFGVTFLGVGIDNAKKGLFNKPWPANVLAVVEAARAQERFHYDFFTSAGGRPLVTTFTLPDIKAVTDFDTFFGAIVDQEAAEVAAQIAAIRVFTEQKRPDLVKIAFQYGAEEAEHRVLANYTRGARPANNIAFAAAPFTNVGEVLASMRQRGIIDGPVPGATFPGPGSIDPTNVIERTPGGVAVACTPAAPAQPLPNTAVEGSPVMFAETGYSLEGRFLKYWQTYGGLAVFGYPIDSQRQVNGLVSQWFERTRFEMQPQNSGPYSVLLGRLAVEALERQGRDWQTFAKADASAPHYFFQTGHAITHAAFWSYWSGYGLEFDSQRGISTAESLALFGYPLSEAQVETNADGVSVLTQWFERARFEFHPDNPQSSQVLLGRLGAEVMSR